MEFERFLQGSTIMKLYPLLDYWQMQTSAGMVSIFMPVTVTVRGVTQDLRNAGTADILNHQIKDELLVPDESYHLILDNAYELRISLLPEDYTSPEALIVRLNSGRLVVFP